MTGNGFVEDGDGWATKGGKNRGGKGAPSVVWSYEWNDYVLVNKGKGRGKGKENKGKGKGKQVDGEGKAGGGNGGPKPAVVQCLNPKCEKCANGNGVNLVKWEKAYEGGAADDRALSCKFCTVKFDMNQAVLKELLKKKESGKKVAYPGAKAKGTTNLDLPPTPEEVKEIFDEDDLQHLHNKLQKLQGFGVVVPEGWRELRNKVMAGTTSDHGKLAMLDYMVPIPGTIKPRAEINLIGAKVAELKYKRSQAEQKLEKAMDKHAKGAIAITEANERQRENQNEVNEARTAYTLAGEAVVEACTQQDSIREKAETEAKNIPYYSPAETSQDVEDMDAEDDELRVTVTAQVMKAAEEQFIEWKIRAHAEFVQQFAIEREKLKTEKPTEVTMGAYVSPAFTLNKEKVNAAAKESQKALKAARKASAAGGVTKKPKVIGAGTPAQAAKQAFDDAEGSKAALEADAAAALEMNSEL